MPFVTDSNLNKYAIDPTQYPETNKMLVGFIKGKRINVTYYRLLRQGGSNLRNNIADYSATRDALNTEYQKIINLEITLVKGFEFTANNSSVSASISGQAMFYPNMNPNIGDIFVTGTGDGRIGIFRISSITPMSWRTDRIYTVNFILNSFADPSDITALEGSVTITSVFSKENYLGGTAALLSEQTYIQLLQIKETRSNLCRYYHQKFFDTDACTFIRPDGLYDPWVVMFMANKITMNDVNVRAKNLLGNSGHAQKAYNQTIWARLNDRFNNTLQGLAPYVDTVGYRETRLGVFVTELVGRSIVFPETDPLQGEAYIFTPTFYAGTIASMTVEELLFYNAITMRLAGDLTGLITNYLDLVYTLTDDEQYYKIPLYLHLIDMSLQSQYREIDAPSMSYASSGDSGD